MPVLTPATTAYAKGERPMANRRAIRCAGCGILAPPDVDVASGPDFKAGDVIEWLCDHCRAAAAAMRQPVPHYTTLAEIGRDAMGVVYKARHNQSGRMVALKLILPESAPSRSAIERFLREMSVISQLKPPNVVECFEHGTTRGQFWLAFP
jgi:serine/threonine-protein kinase